MFRGNAAKTGEMPGPDVVGPPSVIWKLEAPRGEWLAPAVSENRVFASRYLGGLAAFATDAGTPLWAVPAGQYDTFDSSPAVAGGLVVTGAGPYTVLAADAASGEVRWRYEAEVDLSGIPVAGRDYAETIYGSFFTSPTIADDSVYVSAWSATGDGTIGENPANGFYAIDLATGRLRWHVPVVHGAISSPAVVADVVYVIDRLATIYALDARTGQALWKVTVGGTATSSPALADEIVVAAIRGRPEAPGGTVLALKPGTGVIAWRHAVIEPSSPAISGGIVYVAARDGTLMALQASSGSRIWTFQANGALAAPTVVPGGAVYVGSTDGTVYAVDAITGTEKWRFVGGRAFLSSPTVVDGVAYVGDEGGTLYALR
jgi:outer membrane protein assembly factor BamB